MTTQCGPRPTSRLGRRARSCTTSPSGPTSPSPPPGWRPRPTATSVPPTIWPTVDAIVERLRPYAELAPDNFAVLGELVEAERARARGDSDGAVRGYLRTIEHAAEHGYLLLEAFANELLARHYRERGHRFAVAHFQEARALYLECGARGKAVHLEEQIPELRQATAGRPGFGHFRHTDDRPRVGSSGSRNGAQSVAGHRRRDRPRPGGGPSRGHLHRERRRRAGRVRLRRRRGPPRRGGRRRRRGGPPPRLASRSTTRARSSPQPWYGRPPERVRRWSNRDALVLPITRKGRRHRCPLPREHPRVRRVHTRTAGPPRGAVRADGHLPRERPPLRPPRGEGRRTDPGAVRRPRRRPDHAAPDGRVGKTRRPRRPRGRHGPRNQHPRRHRGDRRLPPRRPNRPTPRRLAGRLHETLHPRPLHRRRRRTPAGSSSPTSNGPTNSSRASNRSPSTNPAKPAAPSPSATTWKMSCGASDPASNAPPT